MSRYNFLTKYAVEHTHYDPTKELYKHIDDEIMGAYPSALISTIHNNHHVNADHISKIVNRWKYVPVALTRTALNHPAATQEHHQFILNQANENISSLADKKRFPSMVDRNVPKY